MRTVVHLAVCLLLAVALVWGGCLQPMNRGCCDAAGHCGKHKASQSCQTEPVALAQTVTTHASPVAAPLAPVEPILATALPPAHPPAAASSPPDLLLLQSILRI